MADTKIEKLPTPQQLEQSRLERQQERVGFDDVLRYLSLGITPTAPRLPEQAMQYGNVFGGYPKGYTNKLGAKGTIGFETLRQLAQRSSLLSAIITKRLHQITRFSRIGSTTKKGEVGLNVIHKRKHDRDFKVPDGFNILTREVEEMLQKPWRVFWDEGQIHRDIEPTLSGFMSKTMNDLLVINRPVIELGLDPLRVPRAFGAIDGANIIPTFAAMKYLTSLHRDIPKGWEESYGRYRETLQRVSDKFKVDLDERTEYIYLLSGRPAAGFRSDELLIAPQFPVTDTRLAGYPPSLVERSIFIILAEILAMTANSRYFEYGSMAEVIVTMRGNQNDEHVKDLASILKGNMSGVTGMHRLPFVATPNGKDDLEVIPIKQNHKDMLFDVYIQKLTNLACAVFSMHPSEINEAPRAGDNSGALNQSSQTQQINMAQEQGLESALEHFKTSIFDPILERIDPDLCVEWDYGENEQERVTVANSYAPIATVDERRGMLGLDPIGAERGGDTIDNQFIDQEKQRQHDAEQNQLQSQQEQASQAGAQPGNAGGLPQGGGPGDDEEGAQGGAGSEEEEEEQGKIDYGKESFDDRIKRLAGK